MIPLRRKVVAESSHPMSTHLHNAYMAGGMATVSGIDTTMEAWTREDARGTGTMLLTVANEDYKVRTWADEIGNAVNDGCKNLSPNRVRCRRQKNKAARQARQRNRKNK